MLFKVRHGKMHRQKKVHKARNSLVIEGSHIFRTWFFTKIGIFLCMRKTTFGNLEPLPPSYLVPLAIFSWMYIRRNICKRHCYLAKVQSGTIWTSVILSSLAKKSLKFSSSSLRDKNGQYKRRYYYETWHKTQNMLWYQSAWWWSLDEFAGEKKEDIFFSLFFETCKTTALFARMTKSDRGYTASLY